MSGLLGLRRSNNNSLFSKYQSIFAEKIVTFEVTHYIYMIKSFAHKGLRLLWERNNSSKLPSIQTAKLTRILTVLNTVKTLDPIRAIPGYRLHPLSGKMVGVWSVWVTGNYRILFRFEEGDVYDVDYVDYH
jgi:proteic killer suppression protein